VPAYRLFLFPAGEYFVLQRCPQKAELAPQKYFSLFPALAFFSCGGIRSEDPTGSVTPAVLGVADCTYFRSYATPCIVGTPSFREKVFVLHSPWPRGRLTGV